MTPIDTEKKIVATMMHEYCHRRHHHDGMLCPDCEHLLVYAFDRLDRCPHGDAKPACRRCVIHCYSPQNRERMRAVMSYMGPRMIYLHPVMALKHLYRGMRRR